MRTMGRRCVAGLALAFGAGAAAAQGVPFPAPPVAVTVHVDGAVVLREGSGDLAAGRQDLLIPLPADGEVPAVEVAGARLLGIREADAFLVDAAAFRDQAQTDAAAEVARSDEALEAARDALAVLEAAVAGEEARIAVLLSTDGGADPAARAEAVAEAVAAARVVIAGLAPGIRAAAERVAAAEEVLADARARLAALGPADPATGGLVVTIEVPEPGPVDVALRRFVRQAGWEPTYDLRLDSGTGTLTVERQALIAQDGGAPWRDVTLALSADAAQGRRDPSRPWADIARIVDPEAPSPLARSGLRAESMADAAAPVAMEEVEAVAVRGGFALRYEHPLPVTVREGGAPVLVSLGTARIDAEAAILALPELDRTGYLVATAENPGETLVPGLARYWRDGALVGQGQLPLWAAGAEADLAFGPVETIRLDHVLLSQGTGERGFISRASERLVEVRFSVENTGAEAREVTARYALPVSEQEALEIDVTADPAPDATGVEDVRGLAEWALTLAPGERREVRIRMRFDWPEGQTLLWAP